MPFVKLDAGKASLGKSSRRSLLTFANVRIDRRLLVEVLVMRSQHDRWHDGQAFQQDDLNGRLTECRSLRSPSGEKGFLKCNRELGSPHRDPDETTHPGRFMLAVDRCESWVTRCWGSGVFSSWG